MSVRAESKAIDATSAALSVIEQAHAADSTTAEGNSFNIASEGNPLRRIVNVSIKASLNDFCLQKTRATWAPSQEALRSICEFPAPVPMHTRALLTPPALDSQSSSVACKHYARQPQLHPYTYTHTDPYLSLPQHLARGLR